MTGGAGYIALAAVIFGKWDPIRATLAALLFGFASNLQGVLSVIGSPVPSQFMLMLPYVVTIFAVAGLVGRSRPPAADGIPSPQGLAVLAGPVRGRGPTPAHASVDRTATCARTFAPITTDRSSTRRLPWWRS